MQNSGEYIVSADRDAVWAALNDPDVLVTCIPSCRALERRDESHLHAQFAVQTGQSEALFDAEIELQDMRAPQSCTAVAVAKGDAAELSTVTVRLELEVQDEVSTCVGYEIEASLGGAIAGLDAMATKDPGSELMLQFLGALDLRVSGENPDDEAGVNAQTGQVTAASDSRAAPSYEESGTNGFWLIGFGVLFLAIVLSI